MQKLIDKTAWIFKVTEASRLLQNESINDHCKRSLLRIVFIQVDNLLKVAPRLNNQLYSAGKTNLIEKSKIKSLISALKNSFENSYDIVRNKLAAHNQPVDLINLIEWWNEIDHETIEVFYDDIRKVRDEFSSISEINYLLILDYSPLNIPLSSKLSISDTDIGISTDRLAIAKENTISMLSLHPTQEKSQLIVSIIEFLETSLALTQIVNNPNTVYKRMLFDIGWILVIIDTCSLIDNLFEDNEYDQSLLTIWKNDMSGYDYLNHFNTTKRDATLEESLKNIRNTFCAHIDCNKSIEDLEKQFNSLDLHSISSYIELIVNAFRVACAQDIRTKGFLIQNKKIKSAHKIVKTNNPFFKSETKEVTDD